MMSKIHFVPFGTAPRIPTARWALVQFLDWRGLTTEAALKLMFPELELHGAYLADCAYGAHGAVVNVMRHFPTIVTPTRIFQALAEAYRGPEDKGKPYLHIYDPTKSAQKTSREKC